MMQTDFCSISKSLIIFIFIFTNVPSFSTQLASRISPDAKIPVANWNVNFQLHAIVDVTCNRCMFHIMHHEAFEEEFGFVTLNPDVFLLSCQYIFIVARR